MAHRTRFSEAALVRQLLELGVEPGGVVLVHTSFRAVRPVEGGPEGLISALLGALGSEGTLVMPAWSGDDDEPFDPAVSDSDSDLGIVPQIFWRLPGAIRSDHPHAFAAMGPQSSRILRDPLPLPPHVPESPVGRVHEADGQVLLLGVNHDANTTIHLAELLASVPYRKRKYCTVLDGGRPRRVEYGENDHCCARFTLVDEWLSTAGLQSVGPVGHATARLARSRSIVRLVVTRLERDPLLFLHADHAGCGDCDEARATVGSGSGFRER